MSPGPVVRVGDRIAVVRWGPSNVVDDNLNVPPGTEGTVQGYFSDVDQVWVEWDNGSGLNLMISHDRWRKVDDHAGGGRVSDDAP
jgi:hypothetical protein